MNIYKGDERRNCTMDSCAPVARLDSRTKVVMSILAFLLATVATSGGIAWTAKTTAMDNHQSIQLMVKKIDEIHKVVYIMHGENNQRQRESK